MAIALRIFLVLIFLANVVGLAALSLNVDAILAQYPKLNPGLVAALLAAGVASLVAVVLLWRWKRSGVYLIVLAYAVMLAINLYFRAPLAHTLLGPIGLVILLALAWANRGQFAGGGV